MHAADESPERVVEAKLAPLGSQQSSQVGRQDFYKISRERGTSPGLTLSVFTARDVNSKLN